jgi:hypothetical protein
MVFVVEKLSSFAIGQLHTEKAKSNYLLARK